MRIGVVTPFVFLFTFFAAGSPSAKSSLTLIIDGHRYQKETNAETVQEFLSRNSVQIEKEDLVIPSASSLVSSTNKVVIKKAVAVTVQVEGQEKKILSPARTVSEVLAAGNIDVQPGDVVDVPLHSAVTPGMTVNVSRQTLKEEVISKPIPFRVVHQRDDTLELGKTVVERPGKPGLIESVFRVTYLGGQEMARELIAEMIRVRPLARVVRIGTLRQVMPMRGQGESDRTLPESTQPLTQSQEGVASYYTLNGKGVGMTAAHRSLPFGTKLRVTNLANGKQIEVIVNDRGPFRKGRIIDLATDAFREIASTSQGVCRVRIEW
jgi:3D (Asp-Asp-Asp) domain-containing protein